MAEVYVTHPTPHTLRFFTKRLTTAVRGSHALLQEAS
jgi:hypothetical protein